MKKLHGLTNSMEIKDYINETLVPAITCLEKITEHVEFLKGTSFIHERICKLEQRIEDLERNTKWVAESPTKPVECDHEWERRDDYCQYCKKCDVMRHSLEKDRTLAEKFGNYLLGDTPGSLVPGLVEIAEEHYKSGRCGEAFYKGRKQGRKEAYAEIKHKMQEFISSLESLSENTKFSKKGINES